MNFEEYIDRISLRFKNEFSTEHSYRGDLQSLLEEMLEGIEVTNEPKRIKCGAPDYILIRKNIPVGYIEAKDIGKKLDDKAYQEQLDRYRDSLPNLIITNYLDFWFYRYGQQVATAQLAEIKDETIHALPASFSTFETLLQDFVSFQGQTITSSLKLAKLMASKARLMANVLSNVLKEDIANNDNTDLHQQLDAFKKILIHDIDPCAFSDIYAQTIAYGMFAARLHDQTLCSFSRQEAAGLIPKSNPFLRKLFQSIAGPDLDERIDWIVDALADVFRATDVARLLKDIGKTTQKKDPFLHFYESFLAEYDHKLRKSRGVWYTPEPIVNFIVRAVDHILKTEFDLKDGLVDTSKTKIKNRTDQRDRRTKSGYTEVEKEIHRVQVLDPATGTGTFLSEVIKQIYKNFSHKQGIWTQYVDKELIPRVNGFELLMASYAMAHLKLELLLRDTGYVTNGNKRLQIYLTNALEEHHPDTGTLFASWLSNEANEANYIKRDIPIMVVLGNPPYSVSSSNKSKWIESLLKEYKVGLDDKNIQPLSDDYIKFIRYGQHLIEKTGKGILAFISNNSFLDGLIHRRMREHLVHFFDKIYILDLHGSTKKNESAPDGSQDTNVFDIQQGVSINFFIKTMKNKSKAKAKVFTYDLYGSRDFKYNFLWENGLEQIEFNSLAFPDSYFFFVKKDYRAAKSYRKGFRLSTLFSLHGAGVQTKRDDLFVDFDKHALESRMRKLLTGNFSEEEKKYYKINDSSSYKLLDKVNNSKFEDAHLSTINYRVFDDRSIYYDPKLLGRPFYNVMQHMQQSNIGLITCKQQSSFDFQHAFLSKTITDHNSISLQTKEASYFFPLYLYPCDSSGQTDFISAHGSRLPNFNMDMINQIEERIGISFKSEKENESSSFAPIDLLDYIYSVLYSLTYRKRYKELLKFDFPCIPYPYNVKNFWALVKLGKALRVNHLLEMSIYESDIAAYPATGSNDVNRSIGKSSFEISDKIRQVGRVRINSTQFFSGVPITAWNFYIGGYQPAQKWLKDRKGHILNHNDIVHYQKIIVALMETDRLMKEIDKVLVI